VLALLTGAALAGPWVRAPGDWYLKGSFSSFRTPDQALSYRAWSASAYGEVGVVRHLQATFSLPYTAAANQISGSTLSYRDAGVGPVLVGVVAGADVPVSLGVYGRFPTYGAPGALDPALGNGQVDVDAIAAIGASRSRLWVLAETGARLRTGWTPSDAPEDPREGMVYRAQVGWLPHVQGRDLGWVAVEAAGEAVGRVNDQLGATAAGTVAGGWNLEAGATWIVRAPEDNEGWGWSLGISHRRQGMPARR
jgi:hypothetical protein